MCAEEAADALASFSNVVLTAAFFQGSSDSNWQEDTEKRLISNNVTHFRHIYTYKINAIKTLLHNILLTMVHE